MCYYCTGSVLEYREKTALEKYRDSLEEYELLLIHKQEDNSEYENI
jgi:hypothetical protein